MKPTGLLLVLSLKLPQRSEQPTPLLSLLAEEDLLPLNTLQKEGHRRRLSRLARRPKTAQASKRNAKKQSYRTPPPTKKNGNLNYGDTSTLLFAHIGEKNFPQ